MTNHARKAPGQSPQLQRASCPQPEQIASLVAAELSPLQKWLVRWHLRGCSRCRREYEAEQLLWRDLSLLAASLVPPSLRANVVASARSRKYLQGGPRESGTPPMFRLMLKRRFATALFATVLLGAGTVLAGRLALTPDASFQSDGHLWRYNVSRSKFTGRITLRDSQGRVISTYLSDGGGRTSPDDSDMELRVDEETFFIKVGGAYNSSTKLYAGRDFLGTVEMRPLPAQVVRELQEHGGVEARGWPYGSTGSDREGAHGFHKLLGVTWEMRNAQAEVLMKDAQGYVLSTERIYAPQLSPQERKALPSGSIVPQAGAIPLFHIVALGRTLTMRGFGKHRVRDASGRTLLFLEARPLKMASR